MRVAPVDRCQALFQRLGNRPRIDSPCASANTFSRPATPRSRVKPRPAISKTSREGVFTRTPDGNVASSNTNGAPSQAKRGFVEWRQSPAIGVVSPFLPTNSARAHAASALSTAVEFAFCTIKPDARCPGNVDIER